jgi:hypothetical protein
MNRSDQEPVFDRQGNEVGVRRENKVSLKGEETQIRCMLMGEISEGRGLSILIGLL